MRAALLAKLFATTAALRRLRVDENGNVIIYVSLSAAVLLGMVGLALDGGRAMITHSEAQAAADAAALAGASQLDQQTGACSRAQAEAAVVTNQQRFAQSGAGPITIASGGAVCLNGLPGSDTAGTSGYATTDDVSSQYIQVTTQQLTHQNTLLNAAASSNPTATIQRTAVAGFRRSLCAASPVIMACDTDTFTPGAAYDAWIAYGSTKGWLSACGNSAPCVQDTLGATQPSFCVSDNSMQPVPGNKTTKAADGINTRFGQGSTAAYPSDLDIVSYPHDLSAGQAGWDCLTYWNANHPGVAQPAGCTNTATITRYSIYQWERANGIPAAGTPAAGTTTATAERRLAYIAVFNCAGSTAPEGFLKTFMIEPAQGSSNKTGFVEILGWATSRTDPAAVHEEVQLYR
jgi:Flp pilus assembly protein TadG